MIPSVRFRDLDAAVDFYVNTLGFELVRGTPGDGNVAVSHGPARLMLEAAGEFYGAPYNEEIRARLASPPAHSLYLEEPELEAYYARLQDAGVRVVDPLAERPWGQAEFTVEDSGGNWLSFWRATPPPA